jgi:branched-chain amino acid aminotransferase
MPINKVEKIWMNGKLVNWDDAKVHVLTHALHYGSSWFEGIRCYDTKRGSAVLCLDAHIRRLFDSTKMYRAEIPFTRQQLIDGVKETIRANKLKACYIRPLAYRGYGEPGVNPLGSPCGNGARILEVKLWTMVSMSVSLPGIDRHRTLCRRWQSPAATILARS